jgi:chemotaxis protein methyltransferase CheR
MDDGVLILGSEERIEGDTMAFRAVGGRKGLYVKAPSALSRAA